jgi:hypothetical protein
VSVSLWLGGYGAAAIVLAAGGGAKAARPAATARAMRQLGLPAHDSAVRIGGAAEVLIGGAALLVGGRVPAALVLASYAMLAVVVAVALRRGMSLTSCGCFGEVDAPPTWLHAGLNLAFAASALALLTGRRGPPAVLVGGATRVAAGQPLAAAVFVFLIATIAYLAYLMMAVLPRTAAAARQLHGPGGPR